MIDIRTVNIVLYTISLVVLCALIYSALQLGSFNGAAKRFIRVACAFAAMDVFALLIPIINGMPGESIAVLMMLLYSAIYIAAAMGMVLISAYLFHADGSDFHNHTFSGWLLSAVWLLSVVQTAGIVLNVFLRHLFTVSSEHYIVSGPMYRMNEMIVFLQICIMLVLVFIHKGIRIERKTLIMIVLQPAAGLISMQFISDIDVMYPMGALTLLLIYVNVHLHDEHMLRAREIELKENRLSLLTGQIRPHFVFNVLNTIYYLCDTDSQTAADALRDFRMFLQDSTEKRYYESTVSFGLELENVRHYTNLEKLRFDQIEVIYDIQTTDFSIPPLTVQPLVENAIRHGCREMRGGKIVISARKTSGGYSVKIVDNGTGYSGESVKDGKAHVGISNVRSRLSIISGAELHINALAEGGTCAEIFIPAD